MGITLAATGTAQAQALRGNADVVVGNVNFNKTEINGNKFDFISVNTPQAVINWTPIDDGPGPGPIDFLSTNSTAQFSSNSDFTVLNRVLGAPGRAIALNGNVISRVGNNIGGNIWFYSPAGVIAGNGSTFSVGGLILTANDIPYTDGLQIDLNADGSIPFRAAAGSTASVMVEPGATITPGGTDAYVALVAPRVVQGGQIKLDGSVAIVAAEEVDIKISQGLFDIQMITGTSMTDAIVHTGSTGEASDSGDVTGAQRVYLAAMPKNDAITMLVGGSLGTSATNAVQADKMVILSGNRNIGDASGTGIAFDPNSDVAVDITIGTATFGSDLIGTTTGAITASPARGEQLRFEGAFASLSGRNGVAMTADLDESIFSAGDLDLSSPISTTLRLGVTNAEAGVGEAGATVDIQGLLSLNSDGFGITNFSVGTIGVGGLASIVLEGNGPAPTLTVGGTVDVRAQGFGGYGSSQGGSGIGGTAEIVNGGGTLTIGGLTTIDASGLGGPTAGEDGTGGAGFAGTARFIATGGTSTINSLAVNIQSIGSQGSGNAVNGGADGSNSLALISVSGATTKVDINSNVNVQANSFGFAGAQNSDPLTGGNARIEVLDGATMAVQNSLFADAGTQSLLDGAPESPFTIGDAKAGTIEVTSTGTLSAQTGQFAAGTTPQGAQLSGASGTGGTITITAGDSGGTEGSMAFVTGLFASANGKGGSGQTGGFGKGGTIVLSANGGSIDSDNVIILNANGEAGSSLSGPAAGGEGGIVSINVASGGTKAGLSFGDLSAQANGAANIQQEGNDFSPGDGGLGKGGFVAVGMNGGTVTGSTMSLRAHGFGGHVATSTDPLSPHSGGTGQGGIVQVMQSGGDIDVLAVEADSSGFGGNAIGADIGAYASPAGTGDGGRTNIIIEAGTLKVDTATFVSDGNGGLGGTGVNTGKASAGGLGSGGEVNFTLLGGAVTGGSVTLSGKATGGSGGIDNGAGTSGAGGNAVGGLVTSKISGGSYGAAQTVVTAVATSGGGGDNSGTGLSGAGGFASGGTASFQALAAMPALAGVTVLADGIGAAGGSGQTLVFNPNTGNFDAVPGPGAGGAGGVGTSGTASVLVNGDAVIESVTISASGFGGFGGNGVTGGNGGLGFGGLPSPNGNAFLQIQSGDLTVQTLQITSDGTGGDGGTGTAGVGGLGGTGTGGDALASVAGANGRLIVAGGVVRAVGTGGGAGTGTSGNAGGGAGTGGRAIVSAQEGATLGGALALVINASGIGRHAKGIGGAGGMGSGGNAALNLSGGTANAAGAPPEGLTMMALGRGGASQGGDAGDGKGGTAQFSANESSYSLGAISLMADGTGGDATAGGTGGDGTGGNANFLNSGPNDVVAGALTMDASGFGGLSGFDPGGIGTVGVARIGDTIFGPNASVRVASVTATARGTTAPFGTGFIYDSNDGALLVTNGFNVTTDGRATFTVLGAGSLNVGGSASVSAASDIRFEHFNQPNSPVPTMAAAGALQLRSGRDILSNGTVILQGNPVRIVATRDLLGPAMQILSPGALGLFVGRDFSIGTIDVGGPLDTLDDQGNVAVAGTLNLPVSMTVADLLRVRNEPAVIRTPGDITIGAAVSPGLDLATTDGTITLGALNGPDGLAQFVKLSAPSLSASNLKVNDDIALTATKGTITATGLDAGNTITIAAATNATVGTMIAGTGISLDAAGFATIDSAQATGGALNIKAGGLVTVNTLATGTTVKITSGDIAIGASGRIGTAGTTSLIELTNGDNTKRSFFGGAANDGGYSLSGDEMGRLFGDSVTLIAPQTASSSATNPDGVVGAMTIASRANTPSGQLGAQGTLTIQTAGRVRVNGAVALTGVGDANALIIQAGNSIEIEAPNGSIDLRGPNNALGGTIQLNAAEIIAASAATTEAIRGSADIAAISTKLDTNDGPVIDDGILRARSLRFTVSNGLYIQNTGAGTEIAQRRGFTSGLGGISVTANAGTSPRIAINGQATATSGVLATGLDAIPLVTVNEQPAPSATGYAQGSTINGCVFANLGACSPAVEPDAPPFTTPRDRIEGPVEVGKDERQAAPRIEIEDSESFGYQPLIDEPVTGSGNDDLWIQDCDPAKDSDCPAPAEPRSP